MPGENTDAPIDVEARVELLDSEVDAGLPEDYYKLPDELVRRQYDPIETRFQHPVIPMQARVILASDKPEDTYGPIFQAVAKRFPIRAARLWDLSQRVERARERFLARQKWEELYRLRLNEHANLVNEKVTQDVERLCTQHEERRATLTQGLQHLEAEQAEKEAPYREEIAHLEQQVAQARLRQAEMRHGAIAQAEQTLEVAEAAALQRHQPAIDAARERRDQVRLEVSLRLLEEAQALQSEARGLELDLVEAMHRREEKLAEAHHAAARVRQEQVEALDAARKAAGEATAGVGLLPEETRSDPRRRLLEQVDGDAVLADDETRYPLPDRSWVKRLFSPPAQLLATFACGSIFGISLALLTQVVRTLPQLLTNPVRGLVAAVLGTFAFWMIGEVVQRATTLAAERMLEDPKRGRAALGLAVAVILAIAAMEMCVERYGIVDAAMKGSLAHMMGGEGQAGALQGIAGWCIAAVVALPFILYHAFGGWMEVRYRMAERCRKSRIAQARQGRVEGPQFQNFVAAVHHRDNAEQRVVNAPNPEIHPEVVRASRDLEMVSRRREYHPLLQRAQQLDAEMQQRLEADAQVQFAEAKLRTAQEALAGDPELQAAKRRLQREQSAPETTPEILELEHLLRRGRERWDQDASIVSANIRVRQAQTALTRLDETYSAERAQLEKQRKPIRHVPDRYMRARIQDAREEWQAAQLLFDAELALVMRLLECPRYLLWWEHLRLYLSKEGFSRLTVPAIPDKADRQSKEGRPRRLGWMARAATGVAATGAGSLLILRMLGG